MSTALSVEKTSKRGGRIVHEKDLMPPPMFAMAPPPNPETDLTPPHVTPGQEETSAVGEYGGGGGGEYGGGGEPSAEQGASSSEYGSATEEKPKPSITDLMKNPSKVVLCKVTVRNLMIFGPSLNELKCLI